ELPREVVAALDRLVPGNRDERDRLRLARLEADRRAGGDVEPHAVRRLAVERQRGVGLDEVIVGADLNWPIAGVGDLQVRGSPLGVRGDLSGRSDNFARRPGPAKAGHYRSDSGSVRLQGDLRYRQERTVQRQFQIPVLRDNRVVDG